MCERLHSMHTDAARFEVGMNAAAVCHRLMALRHWMKLRLSHSLHTSDSHARTQFSHSLHTSDTHARHARTHAPSLPTTTEQVVTIEQRSRVLRHGVRARRRGQATTQWWCSHNLAGVQVLTEPQLASSRDLWQSRQRVAHVLLAS